MTSTASHTAPAGAGPRDLLGPRRLTFAINQGQASRFDPDEYRQLARLAQQAGATHMQVGTLPYRHDSWVLPDTSDHYAAWCNHSPGLLRICPPPALESILGSEHARAIQAIVREQLDIARDHNLKGTCYAVEPMWLPEAVYRAHPNWRGPQCELGRIARRPYFAPSIDEPEVLDLYRQAMRTFAELFPEIEAFRFLTNDSGAGLSWSPNLYPGMNGPAKWRKRDGGARLADWLKALQQGAADAGVRVMFDIHSSGLTPEVLASGRAKLDRDLYINGVNGLGQQSKVAGADLPGGIWSVPYPALCTGGADRFLAGVQRIYHNPKADDGWASIGAGASNLPLARLLVEAFLEDPGHDLLHRTKLLLRAAGRFAGDPALAEPLVTIWQELDAAELVVRQIRQKGFGHVLPFCGVSMRWIVRPLVPRPDLLTAEQTAHYQPFVFTTGSDDENQRLNYVLGKGVFRGESVTWMTRWCLTDAQNRLRGAAAKLRGLAARASEGEGRANLEQLAAQVSVMACLVATARHVVMYQYALDITHHPQFAPNQADYDDNIVYDHRAVGLRKIAREELDNTAELADLVQTHGRAVIEYARAPEEESVFMLGPNLEADLRRKMDLMLEQWQLYDTLYPTTKVWDFEPRDPDAPSHGDAP